MTEILLIRHGETAWNAEQRMQGHLDIPLNAVGQQQAALLAQALQDEAIDAVIASDLQRALDTARAIAAPRAMELVIDPSLRERCFGAFEGLRYDEIGAVFPDAHRAWRERDPDARYPSGTYVAETLQEFFSRAVHRVTHYAQRYAGQKIAIVTHGGVLDCLYRAASNIPLQKQRDFEIRNTSVNRFQWQAGQLHLLDWGDVTHLSQQALDEAPQ